jgi:hypothetical protein
VGKRWRAQDKVDLIRNVRRLRTIGLLLLLVGAIIAPGCTGMLKGKEAGAKGIAEFHKLYNDGKIAEIYAATDAQFKKATNEKQFSDLLGAIQRKLGKVTATNDAGFTVNTFNLTTRVVLSQDTTFERGKAKEVFTFEMNGDKAVLVGYNINSNDLITK